MLENVQNSAQAAGVANATSVGHYLVNRSGASAQQLYKNASSVATDSNSSGTLTNQNLVVLAQQTLGTGVHFGSANQIALISIGASLNGTQVTNFYNRACTYMKAVGNSTC